jgi:hypothetical protein
MTLQHRCPHAQPATLQQNISLCPLSPYLPRPLTRYPLPPIHLVPSSRHPHLHLTHLTHPLPLPPPTPPPLLPPTQLHLTHLTRPLPMPPPPPPTPSPFLPPTYSYTWTS